MIKDERETGRRTSHYVREDRRLEAGTTRVNLVGVPAWRSINFLSVDLSSDASYIHLNVSALDTTYLSEPFSRANASFLLFPSADILCVECVLDVIGVPSENTVYPFAGCCDVRCLRAAYNAR